MHDPSKRFSFSSLVSTPYVIMGSIVFIGLFNMYKGFLRFSFGFVGGIGIGVLVGFTLADTSLGQYILRRRSKPQQIQ